MYINLTNLKIFALLMCPGLPEEKASLLFDIVIGQYAEIEIQRIRKKHDDAIKKLRKV